MHKIKRNWNKCISLLFAIGTWYMHASYLVSFLCAEQAENRNL